MVKRIDFFNSKDSMPPQNSPKQEMKFSEWKK